MSYRFVPTSALWFILAMGLATPASAQWKPLKDLIKKKAAEKVDSAAMQKLTKGSDSAAKADSAAAAAKAGPAAAIRVQRIEGQASTSNGAVVPPSGLAAMALNFDFKPGITPLFIDDFKSDDVGDFPKRLTFRQGNMEVADSAGARYLRLSSATGTFEISLHQSLPERFTLEFDFRPTQGYGAEIRFTDEKQASRPKFGVVTIECYEPVQCDGGVRTADAWSKSIAPDAATHQVMRVRVMSDGQYAKVYLNGTRVANVPNANLGRSNRVVFDLPGDAKNATLVGSIALMGGGKKLYDALAADGKVATQGIYFDVGSDNIRAESAPTLREIAALLTDHPTVKLTIEGHTDNQGNAAANQALSERRAAAVKAALVTSFGADATRLSSVGKGSSEPVAPNTTAEGRAQNRRVVLVGGER